MPADRENKTAIRKLAAIMFTDIVGYTTLMGENEDLAFRILKKNRQIQKPVIEKHGGAWLKEFGDGVLASFPTVSDAVYCAKEILKICEKEADLKLRIGIHEGEVVFEGDDVFGNGVNIASRLQTLAPVSGIYVSESVHNNVLNKKDILTEFIGEEKLKNVKQPVRIYMVKVGQVVQQSPLQKKTKNRKKVIYLIAGVSVIIISAFLILYNLPEESDVESEKSIAVLPFVNMSGDPDYEYFSDGISEEILNSLAHIPDLKVTGRTSSFSFKNTNTDIQEIGKKLNVNMVLEGSVRKSGDILRITAQLINVIDGYHLWSEIYDQELDDIFKIQESIARNIAEKLNVSISERSERQFALYKDKKYEPLDLSLKGRALLQQRIEGLEEARACFEKAIAIDPDYAPAYTDLSITYYWMGLFYFIPPKEAFPLSIAYAKKALRIDPDLVDGHRFIAWSILYYEWDWETSLAEYQKIKINSSSEDQFFYCWYLALIEGDYESAIKITKQILERDTSSLRLKTNLAFLHLLFGKYDASRTILNKIIEQNPKFSEGYRYMGLTYFYEGNYQRSIEYFTKAMKISEDRGSSLYYNLCAQAAQGDLDKVILILEENINNTPRWFNPTRKAMVYAFLGDLDNAFYWLDIAYEERDYWLTSLKISPDWDKFRVDPRFDSLLNQMNLFVD
jgi:TolB-like protein/class 3 adenylate cyclase